MRIAQHYPFGTLVRVNVPETQQTKMLVRFNGQQFSVKEWKVFPGGQYMYTLEGCNSKFGTPYHFAHDWLVEVV